MAGQHHVGCYPARHKVLTEGYNNNVRRWVGRSAETVMENRFHQLLEEGQQALV